MKQKSMRLPIAVTLLVFACSANAGACNNPPSESSPGFTVGAYDPTAGSTNITSTTLSGTCTKTGGNTTTYTVAAGTGLNFSGTNRAKFGAANFINYFVSTSAACGNTWNAANPITLSFTASGTQMATFYGCVTSGQFVAAGTYSDTVIMSTVNNGVTTANAGTFAVSITVASVCNLTTAPGTITFNYTAFGGVATGNTTFRVTCNPSLPYSADIGGGATGGGVVSGLNYLLGINTIGTGGTNPLGGTGSGAAQTLFINGTMAAGQAGTCAGSTCLLVTDPRTLTITY